MQIRPKIRQGGHSNRFSVWLKKLYNKSCRSRRRVASSTYFPIAPPDWDDIMGAWWDWIGQSGDGSHWTWYWT